MKQVNKLVIIIILTLTSCTKPNDPIDPPQNSESTELYYFSKRDGVINIYGRNKDGIESAIIEDNSSQDWWVRVSPDKQKILWYKSPLNGIKEYDNYKEAELWTANIDGTNPQKIIDLNDYGWTEQGVADWSPDGTQLVMAVLDSTTHYHIYITNSDGSNPIKISQRNSLFADPSWSPDGSKIVYSAFPVGQVIGFTTDLEIHVMNKDGSNEVRLTDDEFQDHDPYWSPDGDEISFETFWGLSNCSVFGKWSLRKHSLVTNETTALIEDENLATVPRWTKNSENIFFIRKECSGEWEINKIGRDGGNLQKFEIENPAPIYGCELIE